MLSPESLRLLRFGEAAQLWLESRSQQIGPRTVHDYKHWIRYLGKFFDALPLQDIHIGHLEEYQRLRSERAGPVCINHELGVLQQILRRAGLWHAFADHYQPLKRVPSRVGRALSSDQEAKLFRIMAEKPRWKVAYCCSLITANTTAGPGEIRKLQLRDLDLDADPPQIHVVDGAKNWKRVRDLPLNESALWAVQQLRDRALAMGAKYPEHYLLPHRAGKRGDFPDPTRPMGSWRKAWESLREKAGMPELRMYDLRHHVITKLLENEEVSERTVIDLAGQVSRAMLERYSHIRMASKRAAVSALSIAVEKRPTLVLIKK